LTKNAFYGGVDITMKFSVDHVKNLPEMTNLSFIIENLASMMKFFKKSVNKETERNTKFSVFSKMILPTLNP